MKTPGEAVQSENAAPTPSYAEVAALIKSAATPSWLKRYLENWGPTVALDRGVAAVQPSKATMKQRLVDIGNAAALLKKGLGDAVTREFLERAGFVQIENLGGFQRALQTIAERAKVAAASPALSTEAGKTKGGRGKAMPPGAYGPKTFCAVVIGEAWKFLHGDYPAPRNREAAKAAQAYWLASGGTTAGWGNDPLGAWRPYFKQARGPETAKEQAECLRHLGLHKRFSEARGN